MQVDDTPLEPGRSYFYRIETVERRIKVRRIRNRLGRWFVTGVDLDQQTACSSPPPETPIPSGPSSISKK